MDVELQLQQLELEHELESRISQENLVNKENIISKKTKSKNRLELRHESESLVLSMENVANKENEVSKKNKPEVFHFTPSINDDSSLARLVINIHQKITNLFNFIIIVGMVVP